MPNLPAPFVPPEVDLRDVPIPRDFFAHLAVETFGISYATARRIIDQGTSKAARAGSHKSGKGRRR